MKCFLKVFSVKVFKPFDYGRHVIMKLAENETCSFHWCLPFPLSRGLPNR